MKENEKAADISKAAKTPPADNKANENDAIKEQAKTEPQPVTPLAEDPEFEQRFKERFTKEINECKSNELLKLTLAKMNKENSGAGKVKHMDIAISKLEEVLAYIEGRQDLPEDNKIK